MFRVSRIPFKLVGIVGRELLSRVSCRSFSPPSSIEATVRETHRAFQTLKDVSLSSMYLYFIGDVAIAKATRDNVEFQARANTDAVSDTSNRVLAAAPSRGTRNAGDFHGSRKPCSRIFDFSSGWRDHRRKKIPREPQRPVAPTNRRIRIRCGRILWWLVENQVV